MNLRFGDGGMLRRMVDGVKDLVPEVLMTVSGEEGIKWQEMDSSHVSLVAVHLRPQAFSELVIAAGPNHTVPLGVNMMALSKILRCSGKNDDINWKIDEKITDTLEITTTTNTTTNASAKAKKKVGGRGRIGKFSLKLMTIDREAFAVPDTDYGAHIFLRASTLQRLIKDLMSFGTDVVITVTKQEINFAIDGDHGKGELALSNIRHPKMTVASFDCFRHSQEEYDDDDDDTDCAYIFIRSDQDDSTIQLKFAMRFLASFANCSSLSPHLQISIEKDTPIRLQYPIYRPIPTTTTTTTNATTTLAASDEKKSKREEVKEKDGEGAEEEKQKTNSVKRKRKEASTSSSSSSSGAKKSNEPGTDDIVGVVAFYLAPKIEDAPNPAASKDNTTTAKDDGAEDEE